ncbi:dicarboxylate/amino acid:cation symporter [Panacibacter ginsenosidivorans]|uniref:Dicarboxylate/amino acid:cation symporter n=1 Tax=Panacibacter ginsenosidivorans TaxID=1813871 RepID=A0A5B8V5F3_9BACT|nr:dicarboxylate/amino acid:cation symporter [Panacibacter ginsenosidivorans]QEC66419.1 dicarboxylate/amino acid:cation symporter [Panacibacter ginsenosidivorans]
MKILKSLYAQVIIAIFIGIILGIWLPDFAISLKPMSDAFIKLIKMMIVPIIFCTIVNGIAGMEDMKTTGRVGLKALIYFEILTTISLILGLVIVNFVQPGSGMHVNPASLDASGVQGYIKQGQTSGGFVDFLMHIIPENFVSALAEGNILQVLFFAVLFGAGLSQIGDKAQPILKGLHSLTDGLFAVMRIIMRLAPLGALGAMSFTVGKYGFESLASLGKLMLCFYATCAVFIVVILGGILKMYGFNIFRLLKYIGEELWIVLGTSSSESALPALIQKLKKLGCKDSVVGLVVPTGYSFNLDGTCIYLTMAAIFITQAIDMPLTLGQQIYLLLVLLLTSKGAAGVTGAGFITLAATLPVVEHIPVASVALILGIDRFMSESRAITNFIGNAVATIVVAKWEKKIDMEVAKEAIG